jgi:hypothetical protein
MIACTIVFQQTIIASASAATRRIAHHDARRQISNMPNSGMFANCQFHFNPETRVETAAQIIKRFKLEFDDLSLDTAAVFPMSADECVLELLYELGGFEKKTDAGIEYYPHVFVVSSRHHTTK